MTDRRTFIDRAALAVRNAASDSNVILDVLVCRSVAAAVFDVLPERQWFAVATNHQQERTAAEKLREKGFVVYRPKVFRHPDDDDFDHYGAMDYRYPGYVLVLLDPKSGALSQVKHTKGVDDLVMGATGDDRKPVAMPAVIIDKLRQFEDEDFAHATMKRPDARVDLREGVEVLVTDKEHRAYGFTGTLMYLDAKKAKVLIGMASWEVEAAYLKKVEHPKKKKKDRAA